MTRKGKEGFIPSLLTGNTKKKNSKARINKIHRKETIALVRNTKHTKDRFSRLAARIIKTSY